VQIDPKKLSNIPQDLKDSPHWVVWKPVVDPQRPGKVKKPPCSAKSGRAEGWNENHSTYAEAVAWCESHAEYGLGFAFKGSPFGAFDLDNAIGGDGFPKQAAMPVFARWGREFYKEKSPSGKGVRIYFKKDGGEAGLSQHLEQQDLGEGVSVEVFLGSYCTVTGDVLGSASLPLPLVKPSEAWAFCQSLNRSNPKGDGAEGGRNNALASYAGQLAKKRLSAEEITVLVYAKNREFAEPLPDDEIAATVEKSIKRWANPEPEIDPDAWRQECRSFGQLTTEAPKFLVDGLVPEKCMTAISGHSFNSKSWFAMQLAWALSQGESVWGFEVRRAVPIVYHVPEMHEALVRHYANTIGVRDTEDFLFRTQERGVWPLDDPRMLSASEGRLVVLDTSGFFNPAVDGNDYRQAVRFGQLVFNLINAGCLGVIPLFHIAKNGARDTKGRSVEPEWTLENSVIGSAGYGAMLRSCLRMKNLNPDLNDHSVWLYVQGMKNPGLKPFQLQGPAPLKLKVAPGESPYLRELLSGDDAFAKASALFEQGLPQRKVAEQLNLSLGKVNKLHKRWKEAKEGDM
jgi:hypothetical protein